MSTKTLIGAFEAKTKLPELLRKVSAGQAFTITNRGIAIADLVPSSAAPHVDRARLIDEFLRTRPEHPSKGGAKIKQLIEDGRE